MRRLITAVIVIIITLPLLATEPNPSQRQRELIEELLKVTNMTGSGPAVLDGMLGQMEKHFLDTAAAKGNDPDDIAEAKALFSGFRERAGRIDFDGIMRESYIHIYAKYFTEKELADLITFYETPTGRKSIEALPQLMSEGMEAGIRLITPKMEQIMTEVKEDYEKKRPWKRTMSELMRVANAVEAYAMDHDDKYPTGDYASLKALLMPTYIAGFPEKDIWGHAYAYVVSADGQRYRLISSGADSNFEWDSRRIVPAKEDEKVAIRYRERLEDDLIYADGEFVQLPVQAKGKDER